MELAVIIGIGAFVILGVMFGLLWLSSRRDEQDDPITQEIIIKAANTESVTVVAPVVTQEKEQ